MPSLGEWSAHMVIGLSFGLLLFLLASGFTLTFGLARFVNLAHGAVFLVASYTAAEVADNTGSYVLGVLTAQQLVLTIAYLLLYGVGGRQRPVAAGLHAFTRQARQLLAGAYAAGGDLKGAIATLSEVIDYLPALSETLALYLEQFRT